MNIRKRPHPSGRVSWQADLGMVNGKRLMKLMPTKQEAEQWLQEKKEELRQGGVISLALADEDRLMFLEAKAKLQARGATLREAVDFYLMHHRPAETVLLFEELFHRFLEAKEEAGVTQRHLYQLKCSVGSFSDSVGGGRRPAHEITEEEILRWLRSNQWSWKTWNNYRGDVHAVFEWAVEKKMLARNVCTGVLRKQRPSDDDDEVQFLPVEKVHQMLLRASAVKRDWGRFDARGEWQDPGPEDVDLRDCLGMVVIGFFCGLRPENELGKMEWRHVREELVVVSSGRAKSRSRRLVDLSENARAWLALCPSREGRIQPKGWERKWELLRKQCGVLDNWPHNAMRHTFATMHLAHHHDEKKLQRLLGHKSAEMIYQHYSGLETPANAAKFWDLRPAKVEVSGTPE